MILSRTPREIAATVSLPEAKLIVARAEIRDARLQLHATHSRYLASAAKWSTESAGHYSSFIDDLSAIVSPDTVAPAPAPATRKQLRGLFGALGIPAQN